METSSILRRLRNVSQACHDVSIWYVAHIVVFDIPFISDMYLRDDVPRRAETPITLTHIQNVGEGGGFLNSNLYMDR